MTDLFPDWEGDDNSEAYPGEDQFMVYMAQHNFRDAWRVVRSVKAPYLSSEDLWADKAEVLWELGRNREAYKSAKQAIVYGRSDRTLALLTIMAYKIGEEAEAMYYVQDIAQETSYYNGRMCVLVGLANLLVGRYDKAATVFEKFISDFDPFDESILFNLGICYANSGQQDKAKFHYELAIAVNEEFVSPYYNLGNLYYDLKEYAEARLCYETVLRLDPNADDAKHQLALLNERI